MHTSEKRLLDCNHNDLVIAGTDSLCLWNSLWLGLPVTFDVHGISQQLLQCNAGNIVWPVLFIGVWLCFVFFIQNQMIKSMCFEWNFFSNLSVVRVLLASQNMNSLYVYCNITEDLFITVVADDWYLLSFMLNQSLKLTIQLHHMHLFCQFE